jgi:hypothetical protein
MPKEIPTTQRALVLQGGGALVLMKLAYLMYFIIGLKKTLKDLKKMSLI